MLSTPKKTLRGWQITQLVYGDILQIIENHFREIAVSYMPLKGAFLIASGLSSKISSRIMKDIDILVKKEDFQRVVHHFNSLEETRLIPGYFDYEQPFIFQCFNQTVYLEIKYRICAPARFLLSDQELFLRGVVKNSTCILPSPADAMLIHICHYLHHIYQKFELSFFSEIAVLEEQNGFVWEDFWLRAEKTGIKRFIWFIINMYAKLYHKKIDSPDWSNWYTDLLVKFSFDRYSGLNPMVRRLILELPFDRRPLWLLKHKIFKRTFNPQH